MSWQVLRRHAVDAVVAWRGTDSFTAGDLLSHAARIADQLPQAAPDDEVLVHCVDRYAFAASALAAWSAGYSIALPPSTRPLVIDEIMSRGTLKWLLHDGGPERGIDIRSALAQPPGRLGRPLERFGFESDRRIATLYTSGSTGEGRPCTKTASQLFAEAELLGAVLGIEPEDRILATVPPQHIYGLLIGILVPLSRGASMVCGIPLLAESIAACAGKSAATVLAGVPVHLRALATLDPSELKGVRLIVSSGAPLDPVVALQLSRFSAATVELLGSTETGGIALHRPPEAWWRPLPGVSVSTDPEGILCVDSPFLEAGAARPQRVADRIELNDQGLFKHLGRADRVIKIAGTRVDLGEMERRLQALRGVEDAALTAVPVPSGRDNEIWAMVVAPGLDAEAIRKGLLSWFDPVSLPRRFRWVDEIPRGATGKLPFQRWQEVFESGVAADPRGFEVTRRSATDDEGKQEREVLLIVPEKLRFFKGHFEGFPILSGVVILNNLVLAECRRAWPDLEGLRQVSRLKFRRAIQPGAALSLRLVRKREKRSIDFELAWAGENYNSGTLLFERQR